MERSKDRHYWLMTKLLEEAGELAGAANTYYGRRYRPELTPGNKESIYGEIGDLFFVLIGICDLWETTPDECLDMVITKLQSRFAAQQEAN